MTENQVDKVLDQLLSNFKRNSNVYLCDCTDMLDSVQLGLLWKKLGLTISSNCDKLLGDIVCSFTEKDEAIAYLKSFSHFILQYLENNHRIVEHFLECLELLHDLLVTLDDELAGAKALKVSISKACEYYYLKGYAGADNVVSQLIVYLLIIVNSNLCKDIDVKRLYSMRSAILLFDFEDESIQTIQELILQLFGNTSVLKVLFLNFCLCFSIVRLMHYLGC